jgi:hypothetical protein
MRFDETEAMVLASLFWRRKRQPNSKTERRQHLELRKQVLVSCPRLPFACADAVWHTPLYTVSSCGCSRGRPALWSWRSPLRAELDCSRELGLPIATSCGLLFVSSPAPPLPDSCISLSPMVIVSSLSDTRL